MKHAKKYLGIVLAAAMVIGLAVPGTAADAKAKPKLATKSVKLDVGKSKKVKVKNSKGYKLSVKSKKKAVATAKKKGNAAFVVKAVKAGKTTVVATLKKGKKKVALKCKVTVNAAAPDTKPDNSQQGTQTPNNPSQGGNPTEAPAPTEEPLTKLPDLDKYSTLPLRYDEEKAFVPKGDMDEISYTSTATGSEHTVNVWLPADYSADTKYPVLYLLHGSDGDVGSWKSMAADQIIANEIAFKLAKPMIVVIPSISNTSDDDVIKDFAADLKTTIEGKYSVATGRLNTAVAGYDRGGAIALKIGTQLADQVAYSGAFAPTSFDNGDGFAIPDEYKDLTFVMIQKGKSDNTAGNAPADYKNAFSGNGFECLYLEMDGGHDNELYKGGLYNFARRIFKRGTKDEGISNGFVTEYTNSFPQAPRGKIEKVYYDTFTYDEGNSVPMQKYANVYLPADYDPDKQYNVFYLMHGGGENAETWIVGDKDTNPNGYGDYTNNQAMLNYLFSTGYCEPCIIVNPTFYRPDGFDVPADAGRTYLTEIFQHELRNDLIPAIESKYSTYANGDTSEENLIATRMHRAFAGLSMGSATTYESAFYTNYDIFGYFGPYSGMFTQADGYDAEVDRFIKVIEDGEANGMPLGFFYCGNGTDDMAFAAQWEIMQRALVKSDSLVDGQNFHFVLIPGAEHNMWQWHVHFYNCLKIFFTKE